MGRRLSIPTVRERHPWSVQGALEKRKAIARENDRPLSCPCEKDDLDSTYDGEGQWPLMLLSEMISEIASSSPIPWWIAYLTEKGNRIKMPREKKTIKPIGKRKMFWVDPYAVRQKLLHHHFWWLVLSNRPTLDRKKTVQVPIEMSDRSV